MKTSLSFALFLVAYNAVANDAFVPNALSVAFKKGATSTSKTAVFMSGSDSTSNTKLSYSATSDADTLKTVKVHGSETSKRVYLFTEGDRSMVNILGGKGANLGEMSSLGLPVPPGFTISTQVRRTLMETAILKCLMSALMTL